MLFNRHQLITSVPTIANGYVRQAAGLSQTNLGGWFLADN
jgi:hypothetical protein